MCDCTWTRDKVLETRIEESTHGSQKRYIWGPVWEYFGSANSSFYLGGLFSTGDRDGGAENSDQQPPMGGQPVG